MERVLNEIVEEEHEPKKKKAPLQIVSSMFEVTPAMKRMADERAEHMRADKHDLKLSMN